MISTIEWIKTFHDRESTESTPPAIEGWTELYPRAAYEVALRAVILQGVVAVGFQVDPQPIIEWFHDQGIWEAVSPREKDFLLANSRSDKQLGLFQWRKEAEWALLWMIGKVEALGLPTQQCDTRRIADEIIPELGTDIEVFLASAELRHPSLLLAEDERTYNLWCFALRDRRENKPLPYDLNMDVLYERRYAFEWLDSLTEWDEIICDA